MTAAPTVACRVVPDIPSFSVDDGFTYAVPSGTEVDIGSRVRVRVSGRRVRGFVTATFPDAPDRRLVDVDGVVGSVPSFDAHDLEFLRWCAMRYVTPLSVILNRTIPPNVPHGAARRDEPPAPGTRRVRYAVGTRPYRAEVLTAIEEAGYGTVMVVAPSVAEVDELGATIRRAIDRQVVVAHSGRPARDVTDAWVAAAAEPGRVVVGTREIALWPMAGWAGAVVVEDGRRVMKSPATPTIGVREALLERTRRSRIPLTFVGPVPTLETLHAGAEVAAPATGRLWPLVEVLDRSEEPPSLAVIQDRTRRAIAGAARAGERVFVLAARRGYAAAFLCTACGTLRRCPSCRSAATQDATCARCGADLGPCAGCGSTSWRPIGAGRGVVVDDLARSLGDRVGTVEDGRTVSVGTERDLVGLRGLGLAVAVDVDGMALAPTYRAAEDAFRTLVRLTQAVDRGRGRRCILQTSDPTQPVVRGLRSGRFEEFLRDELAARGAAGFPPLGELIALEVAGADDADQLVVDALAGVASVHGPADMGDRSRWLITARDLAEARTRLRPVVGTLRDRGARVRVDVDPIDL